MPRRFSREEEERIRSALMQAGREIMGLRGVRKTSIDELVRRAGIAKGTFYRFFAGKEALALQVLAEWEREFHGEIERLFRTTSPAGFDQTARLLQKVFLELFPRKVRESGIQGLMSSEEVAHLLQRVDSGQREMLDLQDLRLFDHLRPLLTAAGLHAAQPEYQIIAGLRLLFDTGLRMPGSESDGPLRTEHFRAAFLTLLRGFLGEAFRLESRKPKTKERKCGRAKEEP